MQLMQGAEYITPYDETVMIMLIGMMENIDHPRIVTEATRANGLFLTGELII